MVCAWLRRLSAKREGLWCGDSRTTMHKSRTCLCQAHAMVPKSKTRLTVSTISYQITKSLDIKNVLGNFPYPTIALCGLRPRHFDLAFMRNYIALKHVFRSYFRCVRLVPIRNYIALKHLSTSAGRNTSLVPIRNYIALKHIHRADGQYLGLVPNCIFVR